MKNIIAFFTSILLFITFSHATTIRQTISWDDKDNTAFLIYQKKNESKKRLLQLEVVHFRNGVPKLNIHTLMMEGSPCAKYSHDETVTATFNGQAIKMVRECVEFAQDVDTFYRYTPKTEDGRTYIINLFKESSSPIQLSLDDDTFYLPVKGFNKIWDNVGRNTM